MKKLSRKKRPRIKEKKYVPCIQVFKVLQLCHYDIYHNRTSVFVFIHISETLDYSSELVTTSSHPQKVFDVHTRTM